MPLSPDSSSRSNRRNFLSNGLKLAGALALSSAASYKAAGHRSARIYTVQEIIDVIIKEIPGAPFPQTVDTLKSGSPGQTVSSIVTTMFATADVIRQAAHQGANFIIAHEPTFYNHTDDLNWVPGSSVVDQKRKLLNEHKMAVWRFHDYWHSVKPDGIFYGVIRKTGWLPYFKGSPILQIPAVSLNDLVNHLKKSLDIEAVRVIGDPTQICRKLGLLPGAAGGQRQMGLVETENPDVLIVGELHEWETGEYIRDRRAFGHPTALIDLGHAVSEEPGMEWLVDWLQPRIPGVPITHIPSGNPFGFL